MKKWILGLMVLGVAAQSNASHLQDVNADNISIGALNPLRVDASTFTLRGGQWSRYMDVSTTTLSNSTSSIRAVLAAIAIDTNTIATVLTAISVDTNTLAGRNGGRKIYSVVVGSASSVSDQSDIQSDNTAGISQALAMLGAMGLTESTTAQGVIYYRAGNYSIDGATIPKGIKVLAIAGSSVTWMNNSIDTTMLTVYGKVDGVTFNFNGNLHISQKIVMKSNSSVTNFKTIGGNNFVDGAYTSQFSIVNASNVFLQGELSDPRAIAGRGTGVSVIFSTNCVLTLSVTSATYAANGAVIYLSGTRNVILKDCDISYASGNVIYVDATNNGVVIDRLRLIAVPTTVNCGSGGCLSFAASDDGSIYSTGQSSMCVVKNSIFINDSSANNVMVGIQQTTSNTSNTLFDGNILYSQQSGNPTFFSIGSTIPKTLLIGNKAFGVLTFIVDNGAGTQFTASYLNFSNNVLQ